MKRGLLLLVVVVVGGAWAGRVAWRRAEDSTRQALRIRGLEIWKAAGLSLPAHDLAHMRRRSGLEDVSNVSCRNCHFVDTRALPWAQPHPRHASPGALAISADGQRLYVALPELEEVIEVDTARREVSRRVAVAGEPSGLALSPDGASLFVACRAGDRVARVAVGPQGLREVESVFVGIQPVGIACASLGEVGGSVRVLVANSGSDDASLLATAPLREEVRLTTGREPFGAGFTADGRHALVVSRLATMPGTHRAPSAELTRIDATTGRAEERAALLSAHLSEAVVTVPRRAWTLAPLVRVRNLVPITQVARGWVMSSGLAIRTPQGEVVQVPLDEANRYFADPSGLVVDGGGHRAYVASGGGDAVTVVDLDRLGDWLEHADAETRRTAIHDLELSGEYVVGRIPTGRNPRHLALSPDGARLFVAEFLEDAVSVFDTASLKLLGRVVLGNGGLEDPVRRGERMFTWAGKTFQGQFSCRSCHPDGHVDGLNYDFDGDGVGDNLLDNRSLQGVAGTWPFKWNGKNPSLKVQCGPRFAKVLMRTDPFDGAQLDDLTRYVESLPPARTRHVRDLEWTPARERGRQLFFATRRPDGREIPEERRCSTCHQPPLYTSRAKTSVGTGTRFDASDIFDTPHLLGIAASGPYLHDGRARSLEELWTVYQTNDLHGVSSYMSKQQLNDLVEFLKTL